MTIEKMAETLGVNFYDLQPLILEREQSARKEVTDWIDYLIIGVYGVEWEHRLDGDRKGDGNGM